MTGYQTSILSIEKQTMVKTLQLTSSNIQIGMDNLNYFSHFTCENCIWPILFSQISLFDKNQYQAAYIKHLHFSVVKLQLTKITEV